MSVYHILMIELLRQAVNIRAVHLYCDKLLLQLITSTTDRIIRNSLESQCTHRVGLPWTLPPL